MIDETADNSHTLSGHVPSQAALADSLDASDPSAARLVQDDDTTIFPHDIDIPLHRYAIYLVVNYNPDHPISLYAAYAKDAPAIVLTAHPERFVALAREDGLTIDSPEAAIAWGRAFLETTRTNDDLFYIVSSIGDVEALPEPTPDEAASINEFRDAFEAIIGPPNVEGGGPPFMVVVWAIREQALEQHRLSIGRAGEVSDEITVVANDLPLVYSG